MSALRRLGAVVAVCALVALHASANIAIGSEDFGADRAAAGGNDAPRTCEMSAEYTDDVGFIYSISQTGQEVSAVVIFTPQGKAVGWIYANGTIDSSSSRITMIFNYTKTTVTVAGTLKWDCSEIDFDNKAVWIRPDPTLKTIHLVYMTHLDVGFTNGARNVCDEYFDDHFPKAMQTAAELRRLGGKERFVYTQFPWLVHEYATGAAGCAHTPRTTQQLSDFKAAVQRGDINWHAMPLNILTELYEPQHFNWSLGIKDTLNELFGTKNGLLCGKHTDVPGMSRSVVPYLAGRGVQAVHVGYNAACMFPAIPRVFRWLEGVSGAELIVMAEPTYGQEVRVEQAADAALVFMYTSDNGEPPNAEQVSAFWDRLRVRYPNAVVNVDDPLDSYTSLLVSVREKLPLVTREIGDSWLYGAPADPYRIAAYRTAITTVQELVRDGELDARNPAVDEFLFRLMKPMEHNWGLSVGKYLPTLRSDTRGNWSNAQFHAVRNRSDYQRLAEEWREQNEFCEPAKKRPARAAPLSERHATEWERFTRLLHLKQSSLRNARHPSVAAVSGLAKVSATPQDAPYTCFGRYQIGFNASDGSMSHLVDTRTNRTWLSNGSNGIGAFRYRTYSMADFDAFNRGYNPRCGPPCPDFSKQGMNQADAESAVWSPTVVNFTASVDAATCAFAATLALPTETHVKYGAPRVLSLGYTARQIDPGVLEITTRLVWSDKPATRLAEAMFLSFNPAVANTSTWRMDVLGFPVHPLDVVPNGTRHLHAVWTGVRADDVRISSQHTPLVSPGDIDHLLSFDGDALPNLAGGWHFNLYNNLWGTAFPQWSDESGVAVFTVSLSGEGTELPA